MKKILSLLFMGVLAFTIAVSGAFAYFNFSDSINIDDIGTSLDNAKFNEVESDFYKVYFFASPYYATGATIDGVEVTDPLEIADSGSKNPYNQDEGYLLIGRPLTGENAKYANATYPANAQGVVNKHYLSAESIDESKLDQYGAIKMWPKKYWSGYIMENPNYGIYERTSTYVSLTVNANIPSDILSDIIAQTVFKDKYGFGPEFIGWTYDMNTCNTRVRYGNDRYKVDSSTLNGMTLGDSRGWGNGAGEQIGNYGVQGEIAQITSGTSLYYIDNMGLSNDSTNNKSIDGSLKGDHIIYLYPVFTAKNYDTSKMINNVSTPIVKFRVNPEKDENGEYTYDFKQSGEIDYSKSRFTAGFFQTEDTDINNANYYINDIYINASGGENDRIQDMVLDVNPTSSDTQWADHWSTILDYNDLKALGLEKGYYNVYISLWQLKNDAVVEDDETNKVLQVMESFKNTNKFSKIIGSKRSDGTTYGVSWLKKYNTESSSELPICYVIGIQTSEEYRITGNSLNGSINNFDSANRKRLYHASLEKDGKEFYFSDSISLKENDEISILIKGTTTNTIPYSFTEMSSDLLDTYNNALTASNHSNKMPFKSVASDAKFSIKTTDGKSNKIVCNASGIYGIMVAIEYKDGVASNISVSYRELDASYFIFILKSKPSADTFFDYEELKNSDEFLAVATFSLYSNVTSSSVFQDENSSEITISQIEQLYPNKVLKDTATGWEIKYSLFEKGKFVLNRNYVLYLE